MNTEDHVEVHELGVSLGLRLATGFDACCVRLWTLAITQPASSWGYVCLCHELNVKATLSNVE